MGSTRARTCSASTTSPPPPTSSPFAVAARRERAAARAGLAEELRAEPPGEHVNEVTARPERAREGCRRLTSTPLDAYHPARREPMSIITAEDLEASPLADLHALASTLGIDGSRRLRKPDLAAAILARQGGGAAQAAGDAPAIRPAVVAPPPGCVCVRSSRPRDADPGDEAASGTTRRHGLLSPAPSSARGRGRGRAACERLGLHPSPRRHRQRQRRLHLCGAGAPLRAGGGRQDLPVPSVPPRRSERHPVADPDRHDQRRAGG